MPLDHIKGALISLGAKLSDRFLCRLQLILDYLLVGQ